MPRSDVLDEIHRVMFDFRLTGNGIKARQRLAALQTNMLRMGMEEDARLIRSILRGFR